MRLRVVTATLVLPLPDAWHELSRFRSQRSDTAMGAAPGFHQRSRPDRRYADSRQTARIYPRCGSGQSSGGFLRCRRCGFSRMITTLLQNNKLVYIVFSSNMFYAKAALFKPQRYIVCMQRLKLWIVHH